MVDTYLPRASRFNGTMTEQTWFSLSRSLVKTHSIAITGHQGEKLKHFNQMLDGRLLATCIYRFSLFGVEFIDTGKVDSLYVYRDMAFAVPFDRLTVSWWSIHISKSRPKVAESCIRSVAKFLAQQDNVWYVFLNKSVRLIGYILSKVAVDFWIVLMSCAISSAVINWTRCSGLTCLNDFTRALNV